MGPDSSSNFDIHASDTYQLNVLCGSFFSPQKPCVRSAKKCGGHVKKYRSVRKCRNS
jgi:hypothetical protein